MPRLTCHLPEGHWVGGVGAFIVTHISLQPAPLSPPRVSAHGGGAEQMTLLSRAIYSEGVPPHSPGLPRFAATPGRRKTNAVPQGGSVRFRRLRISIPDKSFALCDRIAYQQCGPARRSGIVGSRSLLLAVPLQGTEVFLSQPGVAAKRGNPGLYAGTPLEYSGAADQREAPVDGRWDVTHHLVKLNIDRHSRAIKRHLNFLQRCG